VAFTADWRADAARRDFTINALSCTPDGKLFDPFGGIADLKAGRVRFIEDARKRIEEDRLRLLRFFRFHAHYWRGTPDRDGLEAARALASSLHALSGERVREELLKLLSAPDPVPVLQVMLAEEILQHVLPEATNPTVLQTVVQVERSETRPDALLRLSALIIPDRGATEAVAERLRLSRAQRERLAGLAEPKLSVRADMDARALRRALYRLGVERVRDLVMLDWARRRARGDAMPETDLATPRAEIARWTAKSFPVTGSDVTALGVAPGRDVGRLLAELEAWWEGHDFEPSRTACLRRLQVLVRRHKDKT
jgi:poly(A) polymerase